MALSLNGKIAASGDANGRLRIWSPESTETLKEVQVLNGPIRCIRFSPSTDKTLFICGEGRER